LLSEGGDTLNFEGSMMLPNQEMESARARDLLEFLKMQTMQIQYVYKRGHYYKGGCYLA
jgi:hypothetical protein